MYQHAKESSAWINRSILPIIDTIQVNVCKIESTWTSSAYKQMSVTDWLLYLPLFFFPVFFPFHWGPFCNYYSFIRHIFEFCHFFLSRNTGHVHKITAVNESFLVSFTFLTWLYGKSIQFDLVVYDSLNVWDYLF